MARTNLEKSLLYSGFKQYLGRDPEQEALAAFESSPISIEDRLREIVNSPEYLNLQRQKAANLINPQIGAIASQEGMLGSQYGAQQNLLTSQYEGIANTIRQEQQRAQEELQRQQGLQEQGLLERQNRLGLLRSGLTNTGLADLGRQTGQRIGELQFNTANRLQGLGYEQAGKLAGLDISKAQNLAQLALQRAGLAQKQTELEQGYIGTGQQNVENTIRGIQEQKLLQQQEYLKRLDLGSRLPAGKTFNVPGIGEIQGIGTQDMQQGAKAIMDIFESPSLDMIPDSILKQILESYGFTVTD